MNHPDNSRKTLKVLIAVCLSLGATAYSAENVTPNLVKDGGMEQWNEMAPGTESYNRFKKVEVSFTEKGAILMPSAYEQGQISVVKMETNDVYSGKRAVRLKASHFYMPGTGGDAYNTRSGDIYIVRYMVKGKGNTIMYFTVYGDGGAHILEQKGTPVPDKWTLIEERILVGGASPTTIYPRLTASEEMLIDDVFVGRVLRADEQTEAKRVPKEYDERIAFASMAAAPAPAMDGKLDEQAWQSAVPFSGFRLTREQTLLAPQQAYFRLLYDEKAIYLGIEIMLPDARQVLEDLKANPLKDSAGKPHDKTGDIYTDRHSIEIFIQPPGQARYVQYMVSLDGYRYDGAGMDASWNGQWTYGISAEKDRWFLEMMIPAADLKLEKVTSTEGWRLNITDNRESNYSTWSAVGNNFHNPFAFGALVTKDFSQWRKEKLQEWTAARKNAGAQADKPGLMFADRLEQTDKFIRNFPPITDGEKLDWAKITRVYALMNFVDAVYRGMTAEMMYARFFAGE